MTQATPSLAGRVESWFDRAIAGHVCPLAADQPPLVEFRVAGRIVGRVLAARPGPVAGAFGFDTVLPLAGETVIVSVWRLPDGVELAGSPVQLHPSPMPFVGRIEQAEDGAILGFAVADGDGAPPIVELRIDGRAVGTVRAGLPREDGEGFGFRADLPIAGDPALVSAFRQRDGHALAGSPLLVEPAAARAVPSAGTIESWYDHAIAGFAPADADGRPPQLDACVAGRSVARFTADQPRPDGTFGFDVTLPLGGETLSVSVYRVSDGRPLAPSPVVLHPLTGRLEGWFGRRIQGYAAPNPAGAPPTIEFRADGVPVATMIAETPRADVAGYGFAAYLPVIGPTIALSVHSLPDGRELQGSPVTVHPDPPAPIQPPLARDAPFRVVKPLALPAGGEAAVLATQSRTGALKPHVPALVAALRAAGIAVHIVASADRPLDLPAITLDQLAGAIVRGGGGDRFAAWAQALFVSPELYGAGTLYLLDDELFGPADPAGLAAMLARVRASPADLVGLTAGHAPRWHVQGHFLALKPRLLAAPVLHRFLRGVRRHGSREAALDAHDYRFGAVMEAGGFRIEILYPAAPAADPCRSGRPELLADDCPFAALPAAGVPVPA